MEMRGFMELAESLEYTGEMVETAAPVVEAAPVVPKANRLLEDLRDVMFKLRSHLEEESSGDRGVGVEIGMQRASDMIERIIRSHEG